MRAVGRALLVSDGDDLSTLDLFYGLQAAAGRRVRLIAVPSGVLNLLLHALGREVLWTRLFGDLQLEIADTYERLSWRPLLSACERLATITVAPANSG